MAEDHMTRTDQMAAGSHVGCIAVAPSRGDHLDRLAAPWRPGSRGVDAVPRLATCCKIPATRSARS
jgi:hypothetical protein